jgi:hypothetical protein
MSAEETTTQKDIEELYRQNALRLMDKRVELAEHRHDLFYPWGFLFIIALILFVFSIIAASLWGIGWAVLAMFVFFGLIVVPIGFFTMGGLSLLREMSELQKSVMSLALQQKLLKTFQPQSLSPQEHYRQIEVPQVIAQFQRQAKINRRIDLFFQLTIIIASLLVTGITSGLDLKLGIHYLWPAPVLSLIVSFCTAITGFFKFRQRSFNLQQTADSISQEKTAVTLGIRAYENKPPQEALVLFAKRVVDLREEQQKRQQQLEQSSDHKEQPVKKE